MCIAHGSNTLYRHAFFSPTPCAVTERRRETSHQDVNTTYQSHWDENNNNNKKGTNDVVSNSDFFYSQKKRKTVRQRTRLRSARHLPFFWVFKRAQPPLRRACVQPSQPFSGGFLSAADIRARAVKLSLA